MNGFYFFAGLAALATCGLHTIVGGRLFAAPLLANESLHRVVRLTLYYCWHIVTLAIAAMAAGFFLAACSPAQNAFGIALTLFAAALSLLNLLIVLVHRVTPWQMPQWSFFAVVALLGTAGMLR